MRVVPPSAPARLYPSIMTGPQDPHSFPEPRDPNYPPQGGYGYPGQQQPPPGQYGYPAPQWGQQQQQQPPAPRPSLVERIGQRALRRPVPRFGVTITGVGVTLVILGILVWGIAYIGEGIASSVASGGAASSSDSRRFLGFALALVVVAVGYALIVIRQSGPQVTAGIAATALGVPVAVEFATLDLSGGDPVNTDAIVWVSVAVYLVSYLFVRGARGHTIYLGLSLLLVWEYALNQVLPSVSALGSSVSGSVFGNATPVPTIDAGSVAAVSLVFAIAYYLIGFGLDRAGRHGVALPFVLVGIPAMLVGIVALAQDAKQVGTGIVLVLVGLVLSMYGARYHRRFTAWFWGLAAGVGAVVILSKFATTGTSVGVGMIVLGMVFALGGWLAASALNEPDDMALTAPGQRGDPTG